MKLKISALPLFLFAVCLIPRVSFASTVKLTLESDGGAPYKFEVGNTTTLTELSCLNDNRSVYTGESWTANAVNVEAAILNPTLIAGSGLTVTQLKLDSYLDAQYNTSNLNSIANKEVQDAIWSILDNSNLSHTYNDVYTGLTTSAERTAVDSLITLAENTSESASFYSEFTFYIPTVWGTNNDCSQSQIPQQFLGYSPAATPEPSSLILLGTGLAGLGGALRRKLKASRLDA